MTTAFDRKFVPARPHPIFRQVPQDSAFANQQLNSFKLFCCNFMKQRNRDEQIKDLRRCLAAIRPCGTVCLVDGTGADHAFDVGFFARFSPFETPMTLERVNGELVSGFAAETMSRLGTFGEYAAMRRRDDQAITDICALSLWNDRCPAARHLTDP